MKTWTRVETIQGRKKLYEKTRYVFYVKDYFGGKQNYLIVWRLFRNILVFLLNFIGFLLSMTELFIYIKLLIQLLCWKMSKLLNCKSHSRSMTLLKFQYRCSCLILTTFFSGTDLWKCGIYALWIFYKLYWDTMVIQYGV